MPTAPTMASANIVVLRILPFIVALPALDRR
jgi:hypothetical protein